MNRRAAITTPSTQRLIAAGTVLLFLAGLLVVSHAPWRHADQFTRLVIALLQDGAAAAGWLLAAMGLGYGLRRAMGEPAGIGFTAQTAIGVALLMTADGALGVVGWLNPWTAWFIPAVGWFLISEQLRLWQELFRGREEPWPTLPWPVILGVPAAALLLGAACIAPGGLWQPTEFGAYDVQSYHLQLPAEWIRDGAITGYEHNVYSFLPNALEAAYMNLGLWYGSMIDAALPAQLLHALLAVVAAAAIGRAVTTVTDHASVGAFAAAVYLTVPWTIVTGSLAYTEQAVAALGAAALHLALTGFEKPRPAGLLHGVSRPGDAARLREPRHPPAVVAPLRFGFAIGLLCGMATMAKLTAIGFVAIPVAVVLLAPRGGLRRSRESDHDDAAPNATSRSVRRFAGFAIGAALPLALLVMRNVMWTGSPTFPLLTGLFGTAHWTAEQAARWDAAHQPETGPLGAIAMLFSFDRGLMHAQFAYVVFPAAIVGAGLAWRVAKLRRAVALLLIVMALQALFWVFMTHHQSRFLLPMLLPACMLIGVGAGAWPSSNLITRTLAIAFVIVTTGQSFALYLAPANAHAADLIDNARLIARGGYPYDQINALPDGARLYAEGFATPFYVTRPITYHTVWDRSPLGAALAEGGAAAGHRWLVQNRYTHVVIDWGMIRRWRQPGNYGYDPNVTLNSLGDLARRALRPLRPPGEGMAPMVFEVRPALPSEPAPPRQTQDSSAGD